MREHRPTRREALITGAAALAGGAVGRPVRADADAPPERKRALRVAHITDVHVDGAKGSDRGLAQCLEHVQDPSREVDLIVNTGDTVMCVNDASLESAMAQWKAWRTALSGRDRVEMFHALGNHDWHKWEPPTPENPLGGKLMAVQELGMRGRFDSIDRGGWRFVSIDDIVGSYHAEVDHAQREWLTDLLDRTPATMPVCIMTHIPIVTACGFFDGNRYGDHGWTIPGSWMHVDAAWLKDLFAKHRNVKLCLSGHMHQVDRIDFQGVSYVCSGAVCASWWNGRYYECDYGYSVIDLYEDGSFEQGYVTYGWGGD